MAKYDTIAAVSSALVRLLSDARPTFKADPTLTVDLVDPAAIDKGVTGGVGVSICLYRVSLNVSTRNLPRRVEPNGKTYGSPLPLDLYYLLTAWTKEGAGVVATQHSMLGWAMRVLHETPVLPAVLLNNYSSDPSDDPPIRNSETVEIAFDPLALQDWLGVWDKLKPKLPTSVTYVARRVIIESDLEYVEAGPVQTRVFEPVPTIGGQR